MKELDVCSPYVVGQCRREHEAHLTLCQSNAEEAISKSKGRDVRFIYIALRSFFHFFFLNTTCSTSDTLMWNFKEFNQIKQVPLFSSAIHSHVSFRREILYRTSLW